MLMIVPDLSTTRGHPLLNNAELRRFDEMPAIALLPPRIVLRVMLADYSPCHICLFSAPAERFPQLVLYEKRSDNGDCSTALVHLLAKHLRIAAVTSLSRNGPGPFADASRPHPIRKPSGAPGEAAQDVRQRRQKHQTKPQQDVQDHKPER